MTFSVTCFRLLLPLGGVFRFPGLLSPLSSVCLHHLLHYGGRVFGAAPCGWFASRITIFYYDSPGFLASLINIRKSLQVDGVVIAVVEVAVEVEVVVVVVVVVIVVVVVVVVVSVTTGLL